MNRTPVSFHRQPVPAFTVHEATAAALTHLGDQWTAHPGPWATSGHLRGWDGTPFTVAVAGTGQLYVRNDQLGDALPLDVTPADSLDTVARAIADVIGRLY
ncbi:hypothetical protein ABTX34_17110 [Streptomyces sp. NPDC096538]|uniref:hypothetical protein n=1 Tax=Streptomyces sp. NPDC096538 TaxID=3155427 RepID=UPI003316B948